MLRPRVAVARWQDVPVERVQRYWDSLLDAGIEPVDCSRPESLEDCAGLLLTGGADIDPARYGEATHPAVEQVDPARDAYEAGLLRQALELDLSVLAICRGHQLLNVCLGGRLLQHIDSGEHVAFQQEGYPSRFHEVSIAPNTRLRAILRQSRLVVNSRHHQAVTVDRLGASLRVSALSDDGFVEALECERHTWVIGVQWHPERLEDNEAFNSASRRLFAAFRQELRMAKLGRAG